MTTDNKDCAKTTASIPSPQRRRALKLTTAVIALPTVLFSAGCGQKGPLYIPESEAEQEEKKASS